MSPSRAPRDFRSGSRVHCLGVGGIGVSAIAQWLRERGCVVSGSDRADSDFLRWLRTKAITVVIESERATLPDNADALVYSDAVPPEEPARRAARTRGIPEYSYAQALGILSASYETVAVSGSHGKSTTTALIALMLEAAGLDPTVVVGTRVPQFGNSNFRAGKGSVCVVEADDYRGHCLELSPVVAVVTNTDLDHVDAFPTKEAYVQMFTDFIAKVPGDGLIVLHVSDDATRALVQHAGQRPVAVFGLGEMPSMGAQFLASRPVVRHGYQEFTVSRDGTELGTFRIPLPGEHLVLNAVAAITAVSRWNVPVAAIQQALAGFQGTWRRFEHVGELNGATLISDYAHHPTELSALLQATEQWYPGRRILLAYQPHQKLRTRAFREEFLQVLQLPPPHEVIVAEVYDVAGREETGDPTSTQDWPAVLARAGTAAVYAPTLDAAKGEIRARVRSGDVILVVGAGTIDAVARQLVKPTPGG